MSWTGCGFTLEDGHVMIIARNGDFKSSHELNISYKALPVCKISNQARCQMVVNTTIESLTDHDTGLSIGRLVPDQLMRLIKIDRERGTIPCAPCGFVFGPDDYSACFDSFSQRPVRWGDMSEVDPHCFSAFATMKWFMDRDNGVWTDEEDETACCVSCCNFLKHTSFSTLAAFIINVRKMNLYLNFGSGEEVKDFRTAVSYLYGCPIDGFCDPEPTRIAGFKEAIKRCESRIDLKFQSLSLEDEE